MSVLDLTILVSFFALMLLIGAAHRRRSAGSVKSYFLGGNREKWWMLAASGAGANGDLSGTMFLVSLLYVVGFHATWALWSWGFLNAAFLMGYMAVWIRRTGATTAVELMHVRFGSGRGGRMARTAGAILMVTFLVFSIAGAYAGLAKFLPLMLPGLSPANLQLIGVGVVVVTAVYVTMGGFSSVVVADTIQLGLVSLMALAIGVFVYLKLDPNSVALLHQRFSIDIVPHARMQFGQGFETWDNFTPICLYWIVSGFLLNIGGAGGHYGEQRFLAARDATDAAKIAAAWCFFLIPRWALIAGFVFIAATGLLGNSDPEQILPYVLVNVTPSGWRGLIIATLFAAFMASLSAVVNAAASMVVCDLIQPAKPNLSPKTLIRLSYISTAAIVIVGVLIGSQAESIKSIWIWMLTGIIGATLIPNALRWYWWRFNGWGYAAGILSGLATAFLSYIASVAGLFGTQGLLEYEYAPVVWFAALIGSVVGSLATEPTEEAVLIEFYRRVRPFGLWLSVRDKARLAPATKISWAAVNTCLGIVVWLTGNAATFLLIGHYTTWAAASLSAMLICITLLFLTWYRRLPYERGPQSAAFDTPLIPKTSDSVY